MSNDDNVYKSSGFRNELREDLEKNMDKFKDPVILGELVYRLLEERENTNRILKNLMVKIESLENKLVERETKKNTGSFLPEPLLPEIDEEILEFVKKEGKVTAEIVREKFNYKGTNAASSRMNRLYNLGLLEKRQVGKKVFFIPKS